MLFDWKQLTNTRILTLCCIILLQFCFAYCFEDFQAETLNYNSEDFKKFSFDRKELTYYRNEVKSLFNFALDNYLSKGYPYDEIRPISCVPKKRNFNDLNDLVTNDVLGNFTTTLFDSLTSVAIIGDKDRFKILIDLINETFRDFAVPSTVQVFETTIRIIGSLLSAHLYATDPRKKVYLGDEYDGKFLLLLAQDMADRLLPAYMTKTGLPVSRVNLVTKFKELTPEFLNENNAAGISSPMFEFTMLSYLTGNMKYEKITRYAFDKIWSMRTPLDLIPASFNPEKRQSYSQMTGVGASVDSFFEYALKGSILFNDNDLYEIWTTAYDALNVNCRGDWFYYNIDANSGQLYTNWIDSLSGFFPGLQVLAGDVNDAKTKHLMSLKLWNTFGGIPERWSFEINKLIFNKQTDASRDLDSEDEEWLRLHNTPLEWYPLRPEFVESTYFLYRATKDPFYLNIGVRILRDLKERFKEECGFAGIQNMYTGEKQDRMESFVLSETLKYLYLLFDEANEIHFSRDNIIFSTEGHPMWLRPDVISKYKQNGTFADDSIRLHLEMCEREEIDYQKKHTKNQENGSKFVNFASNLIHGKPDVAVNEEDDAEQEIAEVRPVRPSTEDVCIRDSTTRHNTKHGLPYSEMLSGNDRLFDIDYYYNNTLVQPRYLKGYGPIELEDGFYSQWADPSRSQSKRQSTTELIEVIFFQENGSYTRPRINHNTQQLNCDGFQGRRKIRLEKIQPGEVDSYGSTVSETQFSDIKRQDLQRSHCDEIDRLYSPPLLYMATRLDGITIPENYTVHILIEELFPNFADEPNEGDNSPISLGINTNHQLMLDCIPIVNVLMD